MNNKKGFNKLITISFVAYIFGCLGLFLVIKDKDFSDLENRNLSSAPKFSFKALLDRTFGDNFETYVADQFPLRDEFITLKSVSELLFQKKENNGVYIAKDDNFIETFPKPDMGLIKKINEYINDFSKDFNVFMLAAPTSISINKDKLPTFVDGNIEKETINTFLDGLDDSINKINVLDDLYANRDKYLYYKTDHHWTTLGAYYAYVEFCKEYGLEYKSKEDFEIKNVSEDFYGTLYSKGNFKFAKPDTINLFYPKEDINVKVDYVYSEKITDSLYEYKYLEEKDKYGIFLDNNHPLVKVTSSVNSGKKIAIIKDSYAHSMIPFLVNHFEEIHILDLRHFRLSVKEYLNENNIKDVLFLYNIRNIISDRNIMMLKY